MTFIFLFILGATIGSFLGVLIDRLPDNQSILGWSHCDHCQHRLAWYDLFPIVSFLFLGAKCRYCRKKISIFYPLIELVTGIGFVAIFKVSIYLNLLNLAVFCSLVVIFFADLKYQIIPDSMQIVLFLCVLVTKLFAHSSLGADLISAVVVMLPILFLFLITRGEGMGFGDVKLAAIIGFSLGAIAGLIALYLAFIIGAIVGLILIFLKVKNLKSKIAFGPFMVLGMIMMIAAGPVIFTLIKKIYGL